MTQGGPSRKMGLFLNVEDVEDLATFFSDINLLFFPAVFYIFVNFSENGKQLFLAII